MATATNIIIIVLEVIGLYLSAKRGGWKILRFYTQLSNIFALLSSVLFLLAGERVACLRYTAPTLCGNRIPLFGLFRSFSRSFTE